MNANKNVRYHNHQPPGLPLWEPLGEDPIWQALTSYQISMPLSKLLHLLPRFKETVATMTNDKKQPSALVHLTESSEGPRVMDAHVTVRDVREM